MVWCLLSCPASCILRLLSRLVFSGSVLSCLVLPYTVLCVIFHCLVSACVVSLILRHAPCAMRTAYCMLHAACCVLRAAYCALLMLSLTPVLTISESQLSPRTIGPDDEATSGEIFQVQRVS